MKRLHPFAIGAAEENSGSVPGALNPSVEVAAAGTIAGHCVVAVSGQEGDRIRRGLGQREFQAHYAVRTAAFRAVAVG